MASWLCSSHVHCSLHDKVDQSPCKSVLHLYQFLSFRQALKQMSVYSNLVLVGLIKCPLCVSAWLCVCLSVSVFVWTLCKKVARALPEPFSVWVIAGWPCVNKSMYSQFCSVYTACVFMCAVVCLRVCLCVRRRFAVGCSVGGRRIWLGLDWLTGKQLECCWEY